MKPKRKLSIKKIEKLAVEGKDVNNYFSRGTKRNSLKGIQRVNVDFTASMLLELDTLAQDLNISRQAVIKSLLMQALNQHRVARKKQGA